MKFDYLKGWKKRAFEKLDGRGKFLEFLFEEPKDKNDIVFDFHFHTQGSDGDRTPKMAGHEAQANGVQKMAFADHDTLRSIDDLASGQADLADYSGEFINGVEVTSRLEGKSVEVLVYDFDYDKAKELASSGEFPFLDRNFRLSRIVELIKKRIDIVNELGITDVPLKLENFVSLEMQNENGKVVNVPFAELGISADNAVRLGKFAKTEIRDFIEYKGKKYRVNYDYFNSKLFKLISGSEKGKKFLSEIEIGSKKSIETFAEFNRFLIQRKDSPLYVSDDKYWPTVSQVCDFAKKTGGVAIFAHPYGYGNLGISPKDLMKKAIEAGVDGIECMHGFNEPNEIEEIYKVCYTNDLLFTAGSDTHGFYSSQGNRTEVGRFPSQGAMSKVEDNKLEDAKIGTYNLHHFGSGAWRKAKTFDVDELSSMQK